MTPNEIAAFNALKSENAKMQAQIDDLIFERDELKEALCGGDLPEWCPHLTRGEAKLFRALLRRPLISRQAAMHAIYGPNDWPLEKIVDVHISRMRRKLTGRVTIETKWGEGWFIAPDTRKRILSEMGVHNGA